MDPLRCGLRGPSLFALACSPIRQPPLRTPPRRAPTPASRHFLLRAPAVEPSGARSHIPVVYPPPDAVLQMRDSSFLFGSVGTGDARLTINGQPVRVWPNGAWLAYVPFRPTPSCPLRYRGRTARLGVARPIRCAAPVPDGGPPTVGSVWLDSLSLAPRPAGSGSGGR